MRTLLGRAAEDSVVNEIRRFELFTDGRTATVALKHPDLIIERRTLIQGLAEEAQQAGAKIELGRRFHALHPNGRGLVVEVERCARWAREEVHADTVVGGDGAASRVARAAGWSPLETVPLVQAIVPLPKDMSPDTTRVWFVPDDTPYFYWLIPESPTRGALGIDRREWPGYAPRISSVSSKSASSIRSNFRARASRCTRGWVPVRAAGRQRFGVPGGRCGRAGESLHCGRHRDRFSRRDRRRGIAFSTAAQARELAVLRRELNLHLLLRRSLHDFQQSDYSRLVDLLNAPAMQSLGEYSRDEAWKILWRICLNQPRLVLLGLRGLLMRGRPLHHPRR